MFKTAYFCVECDTELTSEQRMYNHGRCPHCGFKGESSCTVVDTYNKGYKDVKVPSGKWYIRDKYIREYLTA